MLARDLRFRGVGVFEAVRSWLREPMRAPQYAVCPNYEPLTFLGALYRRF